MLSEAKVDPATKSPTYAPYLVADLLDDADGLVAHRLRLRFLDAAVGPQVGTADAGGGDADDRVGRFEDGRVVTLVDTNVAGGAHYNSTHEWIPSTLVC